MDKYAQKALNDRVNAGMIEQIRYFFATQGLVALAFWVVLFIALTTFALFEANNAGNGYLMLAKGAAPGPLAYLMGAGTVIAYIAAHHKASENFRNRHDSQGWKYTIIAAVCTGLAFIGVLSNVSSKTALSSNTAAEVNIDRSITRAEIQALQAEATPEALMQAEAYVGVITRQIVAREDEATGWGIGTATEEDCRADLRVGAREICNQLNGDGTDMGLRNELEMARAKHMALKSKAQRLAVMRENMKGLQFQEGNAHYSAMNKLVGGTLSEESLRIYISLFISLGLLIVLGVGFDAVFEKIEDEYEEGE